MEGLGRATDNIRLSLVLVLPLLVLTGLAQEVLVNPHEVCCTSLSRDILLQCANSSASGPLAKIHLTSLATPEIHTYAAYTAAINAAHAKSFGNSFQLATGSFGRGADLKLLWRAGNVATILEALRVATDAAWIAYLDADAAVVDFSQDALAAVVAAHASEEVHILVSRGELIGPGTSSTFNSGFALVRQHPWAHDFVQLWLSQLSRSEANDQEVLEQLFRHDALSCHQHTAILPIGLVYGEIGNPISGPPMQQHVVHLAGVPDAVRRGVFSAFWADLCSGQEQSVAQPGSDGLRQVYLREMASFLQESSPGSAADADLCLRSANRRQCLEVAERLGYGLLLEGRLEEAVSWAAGALRGRESHLGVLDEDTVASRSTLATVMDAAGRQEEALAFSHAAWQGRKVTYGPEHRATLLSAAKLGSQLLAQGRLEEAQEHLQTAQRLADVLGPQHASSISAAAALASANSKLGRFSEAQALYERTARSATAAFGKRHGTTLDLKLGAVEALRQLGRHDEAAAKAARLLRVQRAALRVPDASRNDQLRLARALELAAGSPTAPNADIGRVKFLQEAAEVYAKLLGENSSQHLSALRLAAEMLQAHGRVGEAESWFRRALAAGEGEGEALTSAVASVANNLAMLLRGMRRGGEAEGLLRRAAEGFGMEQRAAQLRALGNLADTLRESGRLSEAFSTSKHVLQSLQQMEGEDDVLTAKSNHALLLYTLGRQTEAATLYSEVLQQAERVFGIHSSQAASARADLEELRRRARAAKEPGASQRGRQRGEL